MRDPIDRIVASDAAAQELKFFENLENIAKRDVAEYEGRVKWEDSKDEGFQAVLAQALEELGPNETLKLSKLNIQEVVKEAGFRDEKEMDGVIRSCPRYGADPAYRMSLDWFFAYRRVRMLRAQREHLEQIVSGALPRRN